MGATVEFHITDLNYGRKTGKHIETHTNTKNMMPQGCSKSRKWSRELSLHQGFC